MARPEGLIRTRTWTLARGHVGDLGEAGLVALVGLVGRGHGASAQRGGVGGGPASCRLGSRRHAISRGTVLYEELRPSTQPRRPLATALIHGEHKQPPLTHGCTRWKSLLACSTSSACGDAAACSMGAAGLGAAWA